MKKLICITAAILLLANVNAVAEQLLGWNFFGPSDADNNKPSTFNSSLVSASSVSFAYPAGNVRAAGTADGWGAWANHQSTDAADALADGHYISFVVIPSGGGVNITNVSAILTQRNVDTMFFELFSDLDGFTTSLGSGTQVTTTDGWAELGSVSIDIPSTTIGGATEFRLVAYSLQGFKAFQFGGAGVTNDSIAVFGNSATGPANLGYVATTNSIKPGDTQNIQIIIANSGFDATNVFVSLSNLVSEFTVNTGTLGPFSVAGGGQITNTFNITAATNAAIDTFTDALQVNFQGQGTDGSTNAASDTLDLVTVSSIFASMGNTGFAAGINQTATNSLTLSNTSTFALSYELSNTTTWLTYPTGVQSLPAGTSTNVEIVADATGLAQGQYSDTLSLTYLNNTSLPNPTNFALVFDVGPKITPLPAGADEIDEIGGTNNFGPDIYEPGETLQITIISTNDGAITVNNITNSMTLPAGWGSASPQDSFVYSSLAVGESTSTTYQISIPAETTDGDYTIGLRNDAGAEGAWTNALSLNVFSQDDPQVITNSISLQIPAGEVGSTDLILTNAGNLGTTFDVELSGNFDVVYEVQTNLGPDLVDLPAILNLGPDTNTSFVSWTDGSSELLDIGFAFDFYGTTYSNFSVHQSGSITLGGAGDINTNSPAALPSGNRPVIAPLWGGFNIETNSIRYQRQADKLVVSWGNRTGSEFQAWLYTNGVIRYVYQDQATFPAGVIGIQNGSGENQTVDYEPGLVQKSILLNPTDVQWVSFDPQSGSLDGLDNQVVTFTADASNQPEGSNSFIATINWGGANPPVDVDLTIVVGGGSPGLLVTPTSVDFQSAAGSFAKTNIHLVNTGDVVLAYTITDTEARDNGYDIQRTDYSWDTDGYNLLSGIAEIPATGDNQTEWLPIGFPFPFYGNTYTQYRIDENGEIVFDDTFRRRIAPYATSALSLDNNAIIRYGRTADKLVVTWESLSQTGGGNNQTFQAILRKDGSILFQYQEISGSNVWPTTTIEISDSFNLPEPATLENEATTTIVTNFLYETNMPFNLPIVTIIGTNFVTIAEETVTEEAILFYPSERIVITAEPAAGTLAVGETNVISILGDASSLEDGGTNSVAATTTFEVTSDAPTENVNVLFTAVGSQTDSFLPLLSADSDEDGRTDHEEILFGSNGNISIQVNENGSRDLSWPTPADKGIDRNYIVQYTTDLTAGWTTIKAIGNGTSYTDDDPERNAALIIYYRVIVE